MSAPPASIDHVAVLGAGVMGHGIALTFALDGLEVSLYDIDEDTLAESEDRVRSVVDTLSEAGKVSTKEADAAVSRISRTTSLPDAVTDTDFVTEAVAEDLDIKQKVFADLEEHVPEDAILATNTSGLSITEIANATSTPSRVVGTHWFNPPYVVPLVEVIRGDETAEAVVETTYDFFSTMDKTPVRVEKEVPGFIGNRIQTAMIYEAFSLLDRGVASAEAIDRAVKAGFGFRLPLLGIFEKVDHSGLDVEYEVEQYLLPELDRGTESKDILAEAVEDGDYGLKTGKGVYDWEGIDPGEIYDQRDEALLDLLDLYDSLDMERTPRT